MITIRWFGKHLIFKMVFSLKVDLIAVVNVFKVIIPFAFP